MKLQFKAQQYQTDAVDAVVDAFAGQPRSVGLTYRIDPGRPRQSAPDGAVQDPLMATDGLRNATIALSDRQVLDNVRRIQRDHHLPESTKLARSVAAPTQPNLDIEMETGTGKTYVYIKTILEMHRRYGWSKFIIVVPSIAIREGVAKSFQITAEHFQQMYGTRPRSFVYNSSRLHEVEQFSSGTGIQVMIINIQAFNARGKDQRRIYEELDDFQSRRPIDVIAANRPVVIIDEPQKIGEKKSLRALQEFKPLMILRYSATHRVEHDKVYRLDAVDAYNKKLVKKIGVRGIDVKGLAGTTAYVFLDAIEVRPSGGPVAHIDLQVQEKTGIRHRARRVDQGTNLHVLSNGIEAYRPGGRALTVVDIDARADTVELSDGQVLHVGQMVGDDGTETVKRRIQIREVIRAHLAKERTLFAQGIKVLSLFFIDEVAKYRDYSREDTLGEYARVFEEEYEDARAEVLSQLDLDPTAEAYRRYLLRDAVRTVHQGYFSIDRRSGHAVDGTVAKRGDEAGQSTDADAYDLILRDKERLLSLEEPVRFVFSHSALREGWDNPNVFVMGMLKKSDNTISRRQEIGRGLRLCVNKDGERIDDPATVHDINRLTVVTDESYTSFVTGLQKEISATLSARPRKATAKYFTGRTLVDASGGTVEITEDQAKQLVFWLGKHDFVDYEGELTEAWFSRSRLDPMPALPAGLQEFHHQVAELVDGLRTDVPAPEDDRSPKTVGYNRANFERREFQALWGRINHRAVYQVDFSSDELVSKAALALDAELSVRPLQYVVETGLQRDEMSVEDLTAGESFTTVSSSTRTESRSVGSQVPYDLLGEISAKTQLTRRTVSRILQRIRPDRFAMFRQNPEDFIQESARIINEQKATVIVEHIGYDVLDSTFSSDIFTQNQVRVDLSGTGRALTRHVWPYVETDSDGEKKFAAALDVSDEVAVFAKLPRGFFIPTPMGNYNPDWAIAFQEGTVRHVYFVAETKGSMSTAQLRGVERQKIEAAKAFFEALNRRALANGDGADHLVEYHQVASYQDLMERVLG